MTFGAFMVVLIAIGIFQNIILYLRHDVIHVKIVLATALMAIARKVIILDYDELDPLYIFATWVVLLATGGNLFFRIKNTWQGAPGGSRDNGFEAGLRPPRGGTRCVVMAHRVFKPMRVRLGRGYWFATAEKYSLSESCSLALSNSG